MHIRANEWGTRFAAVGVVACLIGVAMGACGGDEGPPRSSGVLPTSSAGGSDGGSGGDVSNVCVEDDIRECKVQIDANNCFVGEQQCHDDTWGPCVDADKLETASLGPQAGCVNNPCNPFCQQFDEDPAPDLEAAGTAAPAGGPINGLPSSWQSAGQVEPCASVSDCQFDTYCDTAMASPTYRQCVPWGYNAFDAAVTGAPDFTVPVQCDNSYVRICNRSGYTVPSGTDVEVVALDANSGDFGTCTPTSTVKSTCVWSGGMGPGECVNVTGCAFTGTSNIYVNPPDPPGTSPPGPLGESASAPGSACANNWSVYHPASNCACSSVSTAGSLADVYMYIMLDSSGSMGSGAGSLMQSAKNALGTFINASGSQYLNVAYRTYGLHNGEDCERGTCDETQCDDPIVDYGPLSNATHRGDVQAAITATTNSDDTPHTGALGGACLWSETHAAMPAFASDKHVVVYISDGQCCSAGSPAFTCGDPEAVVAQEAADAFASHQVETYAVALPGSSISLLTAIATAGNTTVIDLRSSLNVSADLTAQLQIIAGTLASCSITIPNAGQIDPYDTSVEYWPMGNSAAAVMLNDVGGPGGCTGGTDEYYLDDYMNPTTVELCGNTCTTVQGDPTGEVQMLGGCVGGYMPSSTVFTYQGNCSAYPGAGPTWDFLTYDNDVPGNSSVLFEMRTGNSAAEASMSTWVPLSTATSAAPDATFGGMNEVKLAGLLGPLAQQEFAELRITVNPTSAANATPTVYDWALQFSCLNNQ